MRFNHYGIRVGLLVALMYVSYLIVFKNCDLKL